MTVDPRAEWRQIFTDVWRIERDFFYDPNMHGVDWAAMRERYGRLLGDAVTRWDVNFVIGELISELSSSHTYRGGGDLEPAPERAVGLLGVDWGLENGAYRIAHIVDGGAWDSEARSPLARPGVSVQRGRLRAGGERRPVGRDEGPVGRVRGARRRDGGRSR